MEDAERIESDSMPMKITDGRDELNLAEFPLCALAHRLRPDQKTLHFEDRVWDELRRETITRQLTITGSDAYGLPTALDDEVLLGLIQLTRFQQFADRKVHFTRYRLIQILGWRNESKSYERLEASLNRWTGVTLYYRNAWWNKAKRCWMDEKFHVLDNVWLCHQSDPSSGAETDDDRAPRSAFVWNEVIFRSFQTGNLKSIDFDFFKDLKSAIAKRLYRFLDKRFFQRSRWEFNLKELAWEHAGLSRAYDSSDLKRKLRRGISELEHKGYLQPMPEAARYLKLCSGDWRVVFERAGEPVEPVAHPVETGEAEALAAALSERGVTPSSARETVRKYPAERIKAQIEVFDWMVARRDPKVSRNPPGFLVSAIRGEYVPPPEFVSREGRARREKVEADRKRRAEERQRKRETLVAARESSQDQAISRFLAALSSGERRRVEEESQRQASGLERSLLKAGGSAAIACRKALLDRHVLRQIRAGQAKT